MSSVEGPAPDTVHDEASFLAFIADLADDRRLASLVNEGPHASPRGWQNDTIEAFLSPAVAWAQDSNFGIRSGNRVLTREAGATYNA